MKIVMITLIAVSSLFTANKASVAAPFGKSLYCIIINGDQYCILIESSLQDNGDRYNLDGRMDFDHNQLILSNLPKSLNNQTVNLLKEGSILNLKMDGGGKTCRLTTGKYTVKNNQLIIPFKLDK
ncbi:MAG: hypothetical protein KDC57_07455 [Saprospiraceae bacterium]|nr:hypothetical protein [Saprospiraceae bacterium]